MNVVDIALTHASQNDLGAYTLALAAGLSTGVGPCAVPRYAAIAAIAGANNRASAVGIVAFVAGSAAAYSAVALIGSVIVRLVQASFAVYLAVALALVLSGILQLLRKNDHRCANERHRAASLGGAFLLGAATSVTVSPCCTPILVSLGALSATASGTIPVAILVAAFTLGHIAPVVMLFGAAGRVSHTLSTNREAVATVTAGVTIALGCYYAVLA